MNSSNEPIPPKVSIIILNWNGWEDTIECLESLYKNDYPNYEVIVIDNKSENDSIKKIKEYCNGFITVQSDLVQYNPNNKPIAGIEFTNSELAQGLVLNEIVDSFQSDRKLTLIKAEKNFGYPGGCNIGIKFSQAIGSDYFLLLNNDTVVAHDFLTELIKVAKISENIGIISSQVYYYNNPDKIQPNKGSINWWLGKISTDRITDMKGANQYTKIEDCDYVYGTSVLLTKDLLNTIGYMDEEFFFGDEEYDFCTRARNAGYRVVFSPSSRVWHKGGASYAKIKDSPETLWLIEKKGGMNSYKHFYYLFKKNLPPVLFFIPFTIFILRLKFPLHGLYLLVRRGDWGALKDEIKQRIH